MAIVTRTTLTPTKLELLTSWLPAQPWYRGTGSGPRLTGVGGFRLDDPAGEVGMEFLVVTDGSREQPLTYQVPCTYRGAPLDGAGHALIGTLTHGVLGERWVYDGAHDPVLVSQLFALVLGRAEPQSQSESDTADPSVVGSFAEPGHPATIRSSTVADGPHGTDLHVLTGGRDEGGDGGDGSDSGDGDGADAQPPRRLTIRLNRLLRPDDGERPALGQVSATWRLPDGSRARGRFAVVSDAP